MESERWNLYHITDIGVSKDLKYWTFIEGTHAEQLAERMTDWLENILQSADIKLSKESIIEQQKLLVDYFNTTIFDDSNDKAKSA